MAKGKPANEPRIIPLADRVLIKPLSAEELDTKSPSGIIIPDSSEKDRSDRGRVIAVGEGKYNEDGELIPVRVSVGDVVLFQWGEKIEVDKEEYYVVSESNVLAILK